MESASLCMNNTVQRSAPNARMRNNTDSFEDSVQGCTSEGAKILPKRKSTGSLERAQKRFRTTQSRSSQSDSMSDLSLSAYCAHLYGRVGHVLSLYSDISDTPFPTENKSPSQKRKATDDEAEEGPRKKRREVSAPAADDHQPEPRGSVFSEAVHQVPKDIPAPSSSTSPSTEENVLSARRAVFEATYQQQELLGKGGFGSVYAGIRRADNMPVAIKHICASQARYIWVTQNGVVQKIPLEVALMQRFQPTTSGPSAVVSLLDWFNLGKELVLVLERPVPCMDLMCYLQTRGFKISEHEAKTIAKQLVAALMEIESRGVFHRDIKLQNILIETSTGVPRVRIIDFGCGVELSERPHTTTEGTRLCLPPELFQNKSYKARHATVWQLGLVMYALLHGQHPFYDIKALVNRNPRLNERLSTNCQNFLRGCLLKKPQFRSTLERLRCHPWLQ